jgi:hypothetical protein
MRPELIPFLAAWLCHHATEQELAHLLKDTSQHIGPLLAIFGKRYDALRAQALGDGF